MKKLLVIAPVATAIAALSMSTVALSADREVKILVGVPRLQEGCPSGLEIGLAGPYVGEMRSDFLRGVLSNLAQLRSSNNTSRRTPIATRQLRKANSQKLTAKS